MTERHPYNTVEKALDRWGTRPSFSSFKYPFGFYLIFRTEEVLYHWAKPHPLFSWRLGLILQPWLRQNLQWSPCLMRLGLQSRTTFKLCISSRPYLLCVKWKYAIPRDAKHTEKIPHQVSTKFILSTSHTVPCHLAGEADVDRMGPDQCVRRHWHFTCKSDMQAWELMTRARLTMETSPKWTKTVDTFTPWHQSIVT